MPSSRTVWMHKKCSRSGVNVILNASTFFLPPELFQFPCQIAVLSLGHQLKHRIKRPACHREVESRTAFIGSYIFVLHYLFTVGTPMHSHRLTEPLMIHILCTLSPSIASDRRSSAYYFCILFDAFHAWGVLPASVPVMMSSFLCCQNIVDQLLSWRHCAILSAHSKH